MNIENRIDKFTDYRAFLIAHAEHMKKKRKNWSYGAWAQGLGLNSTSSITKIINGERDPGPDIAKKLISYFHFTEKQAQYFNDLIRLNKIKNDPRLSVLLLEKMGKDYPDRRLRLLDDKSFQVISNWYYLALREVCGTLKTKEDLDQIAEKFMFKVSAAQLSQALKVLLQIGLLKRNAKGLLELAEGRLETSNDVASEAIQHHHEQMLEHAKTALRLVPVQHREVTSTTFVMNSKNLIKGKQLIREFKQKFERLMEEDSGDQVYQFQVQLFPLTQKFTEGNI